MKGILTLFSRKTNSLDYIPEIDSLRFFAIITVMFFHLNSTLSSVIGLTRIEDSYELLGGGDNFFEFGWWLRRLDLGVKLFFAISGFVLAIPFVKSYLNKEPFEPIGSFYKRRLLRIEPLFFFSLIFFGVFFFLSGRYAIADSFSHFFASLFYSHVFIFGTPSPINPVTWSLETEAQFYLIFPLIMAFVFAYRTPIWIACCFLLLTVATLFVRSLFVFAYEAHLNQSIIYYISHFAIGILFGYLFVRFNFLFDRKRFIWDFTTLLSVFCMFYFYKPQDDWFRNLLFNMSMFVFIFGVFKGRIFNIIAKSPFLYVIGGMCYSLYLFHLGVYHFFIPILKDYLASFSYSQSLIILSLTILPLAIFLGSIIYLFIEKPTMDSKWPKQLASFMSNKSVRKN
jgi:peptidoglycan/LPS O-acetylase OafA/YrhL